MNITSLISSLIVSGSLGYLNYNILTKLDVVDFYKDNKDDKRYFVIMLGGINYLLYLVTASFIPHAQQGNYLAIAITMFLVLLISVVLDFTIFPWSKRFINWLISKVRNRSGLPDFDVKSTQEFFFNSNEPQKVYIYDFDDKLIDCGYLYYSSGSDFDELSQVLIPFEKPEEEKSYLEVKKIARKQSSQMLIDSDRQIKIFNLS
ncbi:hypothetical protein [Companilactobacillus futsaii]|uniref:hypothetical protein n=1 Tax=Companilactobacillus futsaii TaxID=938155 RepID=UPI00189E76D9|nr:hypothetical protein [Companilactobacillus futsaii]